MTEQEAELNAIREITGFLLIDDKKRYLTRLGLVMMFFFKNGYTPEKKAAILRCYRRFRELYAGKYKEWIIYDELEKDDSGWRFSLG
ncbi:hypothetical protein ACNYC7_04475 [Morganella morganii]|uniref:hypothetical protein n=1 Tax=Morganella morganii TaxID=582 RepID=UPI0021A59178|nr:hypothetical protein [Morganella morganii]